MSGRGAGAVLAPVSGALALAISLLCYLAFGAFSPAAAITLLTIPFAILAAIFGAIRLPYVSMYWMLSLLLYVLIFQKVGGGVSYLLFFILGLLISLGTLTHWLMQKYL